MSETKRPPLPWSSVITSAYRDGFKEGMRLFAWWKDGVQQVGTTGTTFKEAVVKHIPTEVDCDAYLTEAAKQEIAARPKVEELIKLVSHVAYAIADPPGSGTTRNKLLAEMLRINREVEAALKVSS
ncbi:hypothetical protein LCGC14_1891030 [marine sediment metagenome]|uniref:Uncharacterized protein n=1 Tax=marine sediment metagenome TaxID=412755 RepID=A0A0F9IXP3_9ZZZZ